MKHTHLPHLDIHGYYQFITFRTVDSTDTVIRDEHHFHVVYQYIKNNPLKLCVGGAASAAQHHQPGAPEVAPPVERRFYGIYDV